MHEPVGATRRKLLLHRIERQEFVLHIYRIKGETSDPRNPSQLCSVKHKRSRRNANLWKVPLQSWLLGLREYDSQWADYTEVFSFIFRRSPEIVPSLREKVKNEKYILDFIQGWLPAPLIYI